MKVKFFKLAFSLVFCLGCASLSAQSIIKVNPLGLAFGVLNASYEKFTSDNSSFTVRANFYSRGVGGSRFTGFGVGGGYRWYISDNERPKGLYVGPIANVGFLGADDDNIGNYTLITVGGIIGYQLRLSDRFTIEFSTGPTYGIITGTNVNDEVNVFGSGLLPFISIATVGYILE